MTPCIETTHVLDEDGYGHCKVRRFGAQINLVHRLAWIDANGRLPMPGMNILHECDNPACINPDHLYEGTQRENIQDCLDRGRHAQANQIECKRGHEFTPENTRITTDGKRVCRTCMNDYQRKWEANHPESRAERSRNYRRRKKVLA